jgi:hypothetical protein
MTRSARGLVVAAAVALVAGGLILLRRDPPRPRPVDPPPSDPEVAPMVADAAAPAAVAEITPEVITVGGDDNFRLLVFPVRVDRARFRVVDLEMTSDLEGALRESGASMAINGGFFDPAERPEGLVVSEGVTLSARSDALGGGILVIAAGRATLAPAEGFVAAPGTDLAIQARPRLVVDGARSVVHDDGRSAERTALCLRDHGRRIEVVIGRGDAAGRGPTLAELADRLVSRGCEAALNLDGGPSTGVAWRQDHEVYALAPRGPLRHAVLIWAPADGE